MSYGKAVCLYCNRDEFRLVFDALPGSAAGNFICCHCTNRWGRVLSWSPSLGDEGEDAGDNQAVGSAGNVQV